VLLPRYGIEISRQVRQTIITPAASFYHVQITAGYSSAYSHCEHFSANN